jgi:hypothetical protein
MLDAGREFVYDNSNSKEILSRNETPSALLIAEI